MDKGKFMLIYEQILKQIVLNALINALICLLFCSQRLLPPHHDTGLRAVKKRMTGTWTKLWASSVSSRSWALPPRCLMSSTTATTRRTSNVSILLDVCDFHWAKEFISWRLLYFCTLNSASPPQTTVTPLTTSTGLCPSCPLRDAGRRATRRGGRTKITRAAMFPAAAP